MTSRTLMVSILALTAVACESKGSLFREGKNQGIEECTNDSPPPGPDAGVEEGGGQLAGVAAATLPDLIGHPFYGNTVIVAGDMDGDGYGDLASTECHGCDGPNDPQLPTVVRISYGRPAWMSTERFLADAELELSEPATHPQQVRLAPAGDVDGDGLADLLVAFAPLHVGEQPSPSPPPGQIYLLYGSNTRATGVSTLADAAAVIHGASPFSYLGSSASGVGDLDHDGFDDFAITSFDDAASTGHVHVFFGGPTRLSGEVALASAAAVLGTQGDNVFWRLRAAGDVDGDGHDDFVVTASPRPLGDPVNVGAYLVRGGATRPGGAVVLDGSATRFEGDLGLHQVAAGDLDGDGKSDLVFGGWEVNQHPYTIHVFLGQDFGPTVHTDDDDVSVQDNFGNPFRTNLEVGDVMGDGRAELVVGNPDRDGGAGAVFVWSAVSHADVCLHHEAVAYLGDHFVKAFPDGGSVGYDEGAGGPLSVGDVNGDGRADLVIGGAYASVGSETSPSLDTGVVYLITGTGTGGR